MNTIPKAKSLRNPALDLLRITAFFFVVCVHFYVNSGYRELVTGGRAMFIMNIAYALFNTCVALFVMLTGYLMTNKTLSLGYYKGVIHTLVIYVAASAVCLLYKIIYYDYSKNILKCIMKILDFTASGYSWYVEMYLGLFLLIPFLNAAYHGMKSRGGKTALVLTLIVTTALPGVINSFRFGSAEWWLTPSSSGAYNQLIPDWWTGIYPITYFFLGSYLREYPLKMKKRYLFPLTVATVVLIGAYNFYRLRGDKFFFGAFITNASLLVLIPAVLIFSFFQKLDLTRLARPVKFILSKISLWTFGAYVVSDVVDAYTYVRLRERIPEIADRFKWAPVTVFFVALCALAISGVLNTLYDIIVKGVSALSSFFSKKLRKKL